MQTNNQPFIQKKSIAKQLTYTIIAVSGLYIIGFLGLYLSSQEQLKGLSDLHHLARLNDNVVQLRTLLGSVRQVVEQTSNNAISETTQIVITHTGEQMSDYLEQAKIVSQNLPASVSFEHAENTLELMKASLQKIFLGRHLSSARIEFGQYALELREELAKIQLEATANSDQLFWKVYDKRYFPINFGLVCALLSVAFVLFVGFRVRRHVVNSLQQLNLAIQGISQGQFDRPAAIVAPDEIGRLAFGFNQMAASLKETTVSKDFVESIIQSMMDVVIVTDAKRVITRVNQTTLSKFGYTEGELLFQHVNMIFSGLYDSPSTVKSTERICIDKQERCFPVSLSISQLGPHDGREQSFVYVIEDTTERTNFEKMLKKRNSELASLNTELEAFSYSVSHDLRAPLRAIDKFSSALIEDYFEVLDKEGKENLRLIQTGVKRMGVLINDILDLSRFSQNEIELKPVNLGQIACDIAKEISHSQPERNVTFEIDKNLRDIGDPKMLRVALTNLLANAWKYTSQHPAAKIEVGLTRHDNQNIYYVKDDGAGFDMTYSGKLFRAFQWDPLESTCRHASLSIL